jgi:hypothetical protein
MSLLATKQAELAELRAARSRMLTNEGQALSINGRQKTNVSFEAISREIQRLESEVERLQNGPILLGRGRR